MPRTEVVFFAEADGTVPVLKWIDRLPVKAQVKCIERIERLAEYGHELRRPLADYLRDNIRELRVRRQRVNYRILYAFHEHRAVLLHGLRKEAAVPDAAIARAIARLQRFRADPKTHTYAEEISNDQEKD